jgi:4-carboxymuconolactone decarboxylase
MAPHFAHPDDQLLYSFANQILRDHFVDQETFDAAHAEWGEAGLVDIIGCLGSFSVPAMRLNTFQVDLKPGDEPPFPDVRGFAKVDPTAAGQ